MASHDNKVSYNHGFKGRCGPIKPEKVLELSIPVEYAKPWKPGNECPVLCWEDNKVQKLKLSFLQVQQQLLNLLNEAATKKHPCATMTRSERGMGGGRTYNNTLKYCRGGEGPTKGSTQPIQQFYQPPRA